MDAYEPVNPVRFVTATNLFDGHDASINIFRRILQASGAEVIHLGHNRSVAEVAAAVVEEDAQAVAVTSYQGGHMEYFRYLRELLDESGRSDVRVFGGGGGTILPDEAAVLAAEGVARIFSPDDGRLLGLQGMIDEMLRASDVASGELGDVDVDGMGTGSTRTIASLLSAAENHPEKYADVFEALRDRAGGAPGRVLGITGTGGSGKSSLTDELVRRFLADFEDSTVAVLSVDPTRRRSGGALLGDRIRMNALPHPRGFMRSMATRQAHRALSQAVSDAIVVFKAAGFDLVICETSGIGQSDTEITDHADVSVYAMTPEYGAATQLEKIDMLDFADLVVVNKADKPGAEDAVRDVKKQYRRNRQLFDADDTAIPVYATVASEFGDPGTNRFYRAVMTSVGFESDLDLPTDPRDRHVVVPSARSRYLAEIAEAARAEDETIAAQARTAGEIQALSASAEMTGTDFASEIADRESALDAETRAVIDGWDRMVERYSGDELIYEVRGSEIRVPLTSESLSHTPIPKIAVPRFAGWPDRVRWARRENLPGSYPFTAGIYPLKRTAEDPTRMFAGEGPPEQTNQRFHYVAAGMAAKRLSTAFDSVTLYGEDPAERPDIYGKVGNSGVSIATLDDAKKLYSGFNLTDSTTSVSMTINGPAPMILAFFLNTAVDQECEKHIRAVGMHDRVAEVLGENPPTYHGSLPTGHDGLGLMLLGTTGDRVLDAETYARIKDETLRVVRGTVQADILKEDQAQNTCIFSTEFALRMMGDIQQWFIDHQVRNFYSVSISGYHMAEAGANPITQLAFTLANGFTFVEYYRARGMDIDDFGPNLSFFFSNGIDAEYAVIGRVARRIWARAMRNLYGGNERSQMLKYHIQTSGRSLHAQEIGFNDIRTTLQALYAIYDNTNSLHTNAYDEAITTPTQESVRRAMAIQLIINRELGLNKNENPLQGSFIIEELTDLVEEAVYLEFERLNDRGGVLGAMERQYQRMRIQEESLYYERLKESGDLPIVGVNTFLGDDGSPFVIPDHVVRADDEAKNRQISNVAAFQARNADRAPQALRTLQETAIRGENLFDALMEAAKVATLGQMSHALYHVGGQYRRSM
ncbi:MAG TPA: methylmalonyl-CoA mutase family protein [Acidimicrobiia bacterium]|nr:methylmalonyl-CoA mutase family protein [Acidimicrobiia bacterium]